MSQWGIKGLGDSKFSFLFVEIDKLIYMEIQRTYNSQSHLEKEQSLRA